MIVINAAEIRDEILTPDPGGPWEPVELSTPGPSEPVELARPAAVLAAITAALATGATAAVIARLVSAGASADAARATVETFRDPQPTSGGLRTRNGAGWARRTNLLRRGAYLLTAARRITAAVRSGTSLPDAIATEHRNYRAHQLAAASRSASGALADQVAQGSSSSRLRWRAVLDERTDAKCRAMDGKTFDLRDPPKIGLPGGVHPRCRCRAVPVRDTTELTREDTTMSNPRMRDPISGVELDPTTWRPVTSSRPTRRRHTPGAFEFSEPAPTDDLWMQPIEHPVFDRSGRRVDQPAAVDPDHARLGPKAPPVDDETVELIQWMRHNNPGLFSGDTRSDSELAEDILSSRSRLGTGFNADGSRSGHIAVGQLATEVEDDHEPEVDQLILDASGYQADWDPEAYARQHGLI